MDEDLPNEFDLVVVGTGFSESIVAAAASRIGKNVLHLDPNEFYGGIWASFNLEALEKFFDDCENRDLKSDDFKIFENCCGIKAKQEWFAATEAQQEDEKNEDEWTKEKIMKEFRKFNIDLTPKLLFGGGKLVELLISSNICRYAEFRSVDRICTILDGQVKCVPCSRTDVFNTKDLSVVEKRLLMKLLTNCMSYDEHPEEFAEYEGKTFAEYLKANRLTDNIIHCVLYAISMSNDDTPLKEGIIRTKKFLHSLGRYGNTPFLFPMYGCGEIPQCFCRLCAVFGGIYCLKRNIDNIKIEDVDGVKKITTIKCENQEIKTKNLVLSNGNIPKGLIKTAAPAAVTVSDNNKISENINKCGGLARGSFITSNPIGDEELNSGGGGVNLLRLAGQGESKGAFIVQLSHYSGTCPKGLYLIHITSESMTDNPEMDLKPYIEQIFNKDNSPKILYSAYFIIPKCSKCENHIENQIAVNLYTTCGPFFELDYDQSIDNAREIFNKMYPDDAFLPRAPDPEEIIIGDEDPVAVQAEEVTEDDIKEQIKELQEGFENQVKCIEENSKNEEKAEECQEEE